MHGTQLVISFSQFRNEHTAKSRELTSSYRPIFVDAVKSSSLISFKCHVKLGNSTERACTAIKDRKNCGSCSIFVPYSLAWNFVANNILDNKEHFMICTFPTRKQNISYITKMNSASVDGVFCFVVFSFGWYHKLKRYQTDKYDFLAAFLLLL